MVKEVKITSLEEFRKYYLPEWVKERKKLEEQGICPECKGTGHSGPGKVRRPTLEDK